MSDGANGYPERSFLIASYFYDAGKRLRLEKGEVLMRQDEPNDRLYLVLSGLLSAHSRSDDGGDVELFEAKRQMFIGVYSFFSKSYRSLLTVVAEEACELAYIDAQQFDEAERGGIDLSEKFMPVVVTELMHRHQHALELSRERENAIRTLVQSEKMSSLGQMAAGIAHELNNAIAVLQRNSEWLSGSLMELLRERASEGFPFFAQGLEKGQELSSRETRERQRELEKKFRLADQVARQLAEMGLGDEKGTWISADAERIGAEHLSWRVGTALHDMLVASRQATHVLKSIKTLGAPHSELREEQDVNESIRESLSLMQSPLRQVDVLFVDGDLPGFKASRGELIQVWTNLIRNACEAMEQAEMEKPQLRIVSEMAGTEILVRVEDNGPGIPEELRARIFQPNVTTKIGGLSFGLGLGLTIVEHIVNDYGGRVAVESVPGRTAFEIGLPTGRDYGDA